MALNYPIAATPPTLTLRSVFKLLNNKYFYIPEFLMAFATVCAEQVIGFCCTTL